MLHILHMYCLNSHVQGLIGCYKKKKLKTKKKDAKLSSKCRENTQAADERKRKDSQMRSQ